MSEIMKDRTHTYVRVHSVHLPTSIQMNTSVQVYICMCACRCIYAYMYTCVDVHRRAGNHNVRLRGGCLAHLGPLRMERRCGLLVGLSCEVRLLIMVLVQQHLGPKKVCDEGQVVASVMSFTRSECTDCKSSAVMPWVTHLAKAVAKPSAGLGRAA